MSKLKVCIAGATGWAGSELSKAIAATDDLALVAAISRSHAGKTLSKAIGVEGLETPVYGNVEEALKTNPDVFGEYAKPDIAKHHVISALGNSAYVVIGISGLSNEDFAEIDQTAQEMKRGVLAVGNFALTVVLLQKFAEITAKYISHWETIDYAHEDKVDAPSGTARELANRLSQIREAELSVPLDQISGIKESRGARLQGTQKYIQFACPVT